MEPGLAIDTQGLQNAAFYVFIDWRTNRIGNGLARQHRAGGAVAEWSAIVLVAPIAAVDRQAARAG